MKRWCLIVQVRTLVCVVLSVLMSLRLQNAIGQAEHNNLDVYVAPGQDDELGQPLGISGHLPMTAAFPEGRKEFAWTTTI